jgi:hypothetical protein
VWLLDLTLDLLKMITGTLTYLKNFEASQLPKGQNAIQIDLQKEVWTSTSEGYWERKLGVNLKSVTRAEIQTTSRDMPV